MDIVSFQLVMLVPINCLELVHGSVQFFLGCQNIDLGTTGANLLGRWKEIDRKDLWVCVSDSKAEFCSSLWNSKISVVVAWIMVRLEHLSFWPGLPYCIFIIHSRYQILNMILLCSFDPKAILFICIHLNVQADCELNAKTHDGCLPAVHRCNDCMWLVIL